MGSRGPQRLSERERRVRDESLVGKNKKETSNVFLPDLERARCVFDACFLYLIVIISCAYIIILALFISSCGM